MDDQAPCSSASLMATPASSSRGKKGKAGSSTTELRIIEVEDEAYSCMFCKTSTVNELNYGPLYHRDGVTTHYYCMLFSAALSQLGADEDGILGFLANDITKEVRRSSRLKCVHCNVVGASIGCCNKKCRQVFHFTCGLKHGSNFQFYGNYEAFCAQHHLPQKILIKQKEWSCPICLGTVTRDQNPVMSSCCKAAVFHKDCMQRMALNAGYFFKCPTCNATKKFIQEMRSLGIFVPEQDASWEKGDDYQDLYTRYSKCDAEICLCKRGREYIACKGGWMLARCRLCGASGTHRECSSLETIENWACKPCLSVEKKADGDNKKTPKEEPKAKAKKVVASEPKASTSRGSVDECDEDEVDHVSARSGNRRLRNGNRRVKRQPAAIPVPVTPVLPVTTLESEEDFDLSKVKISQSCISYFPYTEELLRDFRDKGTLPDWRRLSLRVNLINWIPKEWATIKSDPSQLCVPGPSKAVPVCDITNVISVGRSKSRKTTKNKSKVSSSKSSENVIPVLRTLAREKKRNPRVTRWGRGVLNRSKKARKQPIPRDSTQEKLGAPLISEPGVEMKSESAGTLQQLSDEMKEVELEIIPASVQEKAESLFFSAIEIEGEKLPLQHIPLVRRRKQVFPSDTNRKYFEVNGNIVEVNYSTSSGDDRDTGVTKRKKRGKTTKYASGKDDTYISGLNTPVLLAGQVLKMNVEYDVEISYDGEQMRIEESENSCSPSKKLCGSNWKPISKYVNNTAEPKTASPTAQNIPLTPPAPVPEQKEKEQPVKQKQPSPGQRKSVPLKTTTLVKPAVKIGAPPTPSTLVAALISDDDDCVIEESCAVPPANNEHSIAKPLHEILRRVESDHTYSGAVFSTIGVKGAGKMKSLQPPPEEWSNSAKSWNADMKNKCRQVINASKSYCASINNTPTLTLGTMKSKHSLFPDNLKSAERCISPLRSVDINSNLPDELDQNCQTEPQQMEIWEGNEIVLTTD